MNRFWLAALTASLLSAAAYAGDAPCKNFADITDRATKDGGTVRPLTNDEYQFMRGIFALMPTTPAGLPPGSSAVLISPPEGQKGTPHILFVDGDMVCFPLAVPDTLNDLLKALPNPGAHAGAPT